MLTKDAANLLDLAGDITPELVKKAFHIAAKKYHPDINPAGLKMMQIINEAFETLRNHTGSHDPAADGEGYPEALNAALNAILDLQGLQIEICGSWIWVGGETMTHRATLKAAGFKWASKKRKWHFRPAGYRSRSRGKVSMDDIRTRYGSTRPGYHGPAKIGQAA